MEMRAKTKIRGFQAPSPLVRSRARVPVLGLGVLSILLHNNINFSWLLTQHCSILLTMLLRKSVHFDLVLRGERMCCRF